MANHLNPPQKMPLRQYSLKALYCKGFRLLKIGFLPNLPYFLRILEVSPTSHITKKRRNPYVFYVLKS